MSIVKEIPAVSTAMVESWLDAEFLAPFVGKQPKWGFDGLGFIVELRTYARKKEDGSLEDWWETVKRVTLGNYLTEIRNGKLDHTITKEEVQQFYYLTFNLVITPPGRGLWMSGTEYSKRSGDSMNNCWGTVMRPYPYKENEEAKVSFAPVFTFDQAMKGGGVGVSVQREHVQSIPKVSNAVNLKFVCLDTHKDVAELQGMAAMGIEVQFISKEEQALLAAQPEYFLTPDSREGWGTSLEHTIDYHFDGKPDLTVDISDVRERGADIKSFGGTASGPMALVEMLFKVNRILNRRENQFVPPVEWGDVVQLIGTCVVAGNVRRTALIIIGDQDDKAFVDSKNYSLPENLEASQWRWASNNSVDVRPDSPYEVFEGLAVNIFYNGEPGYVNRELAQNFGRIIDGFKKGIDAKVQVFNPCGEITLEPEENCNLFEVNLPRIEQMIQSGEAGEWLYEQAFELATRYTYRVTFRHYEWESTREVVERNHRLGVAITGVTDWFLIRYGEKAVLGFDQNDMPLYNPEVVADLDKFYGFVKATNEQHAADLGENKSNKLTTIKPSGTISILMGVSPGQHFHWSSYMIRRVRLSASSQLVDALMDSGYKVEPAQKGFEEDGTPVYDYNTVVAEFPIKAPTADSVNFQSAKDVSLQEQAAIQALLATYWSDNAVSATLSFHKPEAGDTEAEQAVIKDIADLLYRYKGIIKSTSLLPHDTGTYPQMPMEEIDEDTYNKMKAKITGKPWEKITGRIIEDNSELDSSAECVGGACPTR